RQGAERILFERLADSGVSGSEQHDLPTPRCGVVEQRRELFLLLPIARRDSRGIEPVRFIYLRIRSERTEPGSRPGVSEVKSRRAIPESQRADHDATHSARGPGVESLTEVVEPLFERIDHVHPRDQLLGGGLSPGCPCQRSTRESSRKCPAIYRRFFLARPQLDFDGQSRSYRVSCFIVNTVRRDE